MRHANGNACIHANSDCDGDRDGNSHIHADGHSDGNAHADSYANGHSNSYAHTDSYAYCDSNSYRVGAPITDGHSNGNCDRIAPAAVFTDATATAHTAAACE